MAFDSESFIRRFAIPLVVGGELHVRRPLDERDLQLLREAGRRTGQPQRDLQFARQQHGATLWGHPIAVPLTDAECALLSGLHNTLFLAHPARQRWSVRAGSLELMVDFTKRCLQQPPPTVGADLVARHTLLANFVGLQRRDVDLRFWVGRRIFRGQRPPARLRRWPRLRRVEQREQTVEWLGQLTSDIERELVGMLLGTSPLTDMLGLDRCAIAVRWERLVVFLRHVRLSRLVAHRYLEIGIARIGPPLAESFWQMVARGARGELSTADPLRMVCGLIHYLYAAHCLGGGPPLPPADREAPRRSLASVLVAAQRCGLLADRERWGDEQVARRLEQAVARAREDLGESGDVLAASLRGALDAIPGRAEPEASREPQAGAIGP